MRRGSGKTIYEVLGRNPVHPFPARMAPGIAVHFLTNPRKKLRVLDPMMGSGTVLALARANGHQAMGVDIDPLAVLISKVWITTIDPVQVHRSAKNVLRDAQSKVAKIPLARSYPANADEETRRFVRYWFDGQSRRQLTALSKSIMRVRDKNIRDVLWCAFSRLIIAKQAGVSLAMDLAHSRPHKCFTKAPIAPFPNYLKAVEQVVDNCVSRESKPRGPAPLVNIGDARRLRISDGSVDLVLTSPPYLNAIDYMRCSKFSLIWMGISANEVRSLRSRAVGSEVGQYDPTLGCLRIVNRLGIQDRLSRRNKAMLCRFIEDMRAAISEVWRVLAPGGRAVFVLGDNTVKGVYIPNSKIVMAAACEAGLILQSKSKRTLPPNRRYLPPPSRLNDKATLGARLNREVVLSFVKPKQGKRSASPKRHWQKSVSN